MPDIGFSDEPIEGEKPQLPPGEGEGEGEEGGEGGEGGSTELPNCPTEPPQPPTDEIEKPIEDEEGGL